MKKTILLFSILILNLVSNAQTKQKASNFEKYLGAALVVHVGTAYFHGVESKSNPMNTYYKNSCIFLSSALLVCALKELKVKRIEPSKSGFGIAYKF